MRKRKSIGPWASEFAALAQELGFAEQADPVDNQPGLDTEDNAFNSTTWMRIYYMTDAPKVLR